MSVDPAPVTGPDPGLGPASSDSPAPAPARDGGSVGWMGELDRWAYFWPLALVIALKYNFDRLYVNLVLGRHWFAYDYFTGKWQSAFEPLPELSHGVTIPALVLLTWIPVLAFALWFSVRRLRSIGAGPGWAVLILVPVVQWFAFLLFSTIPRRPGAETEAEDASPESPRPQTWLDRWIPATSRLACAMASTLIVGVGGTAVALGATLLLGNYGGMLFMGLPFVCGFVSVGLYNRRPRAANDREIIVMSVLPLGFIGLALLALAAEGIVCLTMAAPLAVIWSIAGGAVAAAVWPPARRRGAMPARVMLLIFAALPLFIGAESIGDAKPAVVAITTSVIVNAPPEAVWPNVVAFPPIPPERHWILHIGIAYPTSAEIRGKGVGAIRHCNFSTGPFVEPITAWDEARLLAFDVTAQPPTLEETSPYGHIHAPHLTGYLQSQRGQIRLQPLPGGKTLLEGTTWYTNRMWPAAYWHLWTDYIIHKIHLRVLEHIKATTEGEGSLKN